MTNKKRVTNEGGYLVFVLGRPTAFFAVFAGAAFGLVVGTPVFFSGAMNLPRDSFLRSSAAMIVAGCAPAWLFPFGVDGRV